MKARARPTLERIRLGRILREHRHHSGKSVTDVANHLSSNTAKVSNVEDGTATFSQAELEEVLKFYEIEPSERGEILELGHAARKRAPRRRVVEKIPESFPRFSLLEAEATRIRTYQVGIVPGRLQCPQYARATVEASCGIWWDESEFEDRLRFAQKEQSFSKDKERTFILTESALDGLDGDGVMREQGRYLLDLSRADNGIAVHIIPRRTRRHCAQGGGFTIFDFGERLPRVCYSSLVYGAPVFIDALEETNRYMNAWRELATLSLTAQDTRDYISKKVGLR